MTQDDIFAELGIAGATEEKKREVVLGLIKKVDLQFANIVDDILEDNQKLELERISEQSSNPAEIVQWLQQNVPKAAELYSAILTDEVEMLKEKLG